MPAVAEDGPSRFSFDEAKRRERAAVLGADAAARDEADGVKAPLAALCLSGGGIRSAAFCLGVLQALAGAGLLRRFHYLSTVSGGGYIGCWLQAWVLARARQSGRRWVTQADILGVEGLLGAEVAAPAVQRLRGFTSFLTPRPGLASPDTWTGIVLWLRNVLINWAIFMPALFALATSPLVYRHVLMAIGNDATPWLLAAALLPAGIAAFFACSRLPSHAHGTPPDYTAAASIGWYCVAPALLWAAMAPLTLAPFLLSAGGRLDPALRIWRWGPAHVVPLTMFLTLMAAYVAAWLWCARRGRATHLYRANLVPWIAGCGVACAVLGAGIRLAAALPADGILTPALLAIFGPAVVILSHLCLSAAFVALRREVLRGDLDREWLARLSAIKFVPVLIWAALAAVCLLLGHLVVETDWHAAYVSASAVVAAVTSVAGVLGAVLGGSGKSTGLGGKGVLSVDTLATVLTFVFAAGLFTLLASAAAALLARLAPHGGPAAMAADGLVTAALALAVAAALGHHINVNRFSLHGLYRNRLSRAFLGSVRPPPHPASNPLRRTPDPFTDFDPSDNPRMQELAPQPGQPRRLFPVIHTAMNLVSGAPRAWQERKAAPFSITPVACGSDSLPKPRAFAATPHYGGSEPETGQPNEPMGMTLATAMALSGAAVSPNMGYNSSPWTAFLMTLFNVRLGAWLPNPATVGARRLRDGKPPNALRALADEMLGRTGSTGPAIYLSDGGHFDDLGLYAMVRRDCRMIVVIDAGEDAAFAFADLAGAVRKIRIDMNVDIDFTMPMPMGPEANWTVASRPYALADIVWRDPPARGRLLYIKPCRVPAMPVDVRGYATQDTGFPHDSTLDQFFTESRFESYRKLGRCIGEMAASDPALARFLAELPPAESS